ncbi:hypothetical protein M9Y10_017224 [Tritrichomonas musculus]|uniref:Uncharacterized protein n=1 Tax=Tritrichomonas musculus TaxID=1915356 RepID=A0ABR2HX80_9EUKA
MTQRNTVKVSDMNQMIPIQPFDPLKFIEKQVKLLHFKQDLRMKTFFMQPLSYSTTEEFDKAIDDLEKYVQNTEFNYNFDEEKSEINALKTQRRFAEMNEKEEKRMIEDLEKMCYKSKEYLFDIIDKKMFFNETNTKIIIERIIEKLIGSSDDEMLKMYNEGFVQVSFSKKAKELVNTINQIFERLRNIMFTFFDKIQITYNGQIVNDFKGKLIGLNNAASNLLMDYIETFIIVYQKPISATKQYQKVYIENLCTDLVKNASQRWMPEINETLNGMTRGRIQCFIEKIHHHYPQLKDEEIIPQEKVGPIIEEPEDNIQNERRKASNKKTFECFYAKLDKDWYQTDELVQLYNDYFQTNLASVIFGILDDVKSHFKRARRRINKFEVYGYEKIKKS